MRPDINYAAINLHCQQIAKRNAAGHSLQLTVTQLLIQVSKSGTVLYEKCGRNARVKTKTRHIVSLVDQSFLHHATVLNNGPGRDVQEAIATSFAFVSVRIMFSYFG